MVIEMFKATKKHYSTEDPLQFASAKEFAQFVKNECDYFCAMEKNGYYLRGIEMFDDEDNDDKVIISCFIDNHDMEEFLHFGIEKSQIEAACKAIKDVVGKSINDCTKDKLVPEDYKPKTFVIRYR